MLVNEVVFGKAGSIISGLTLLVLVCESLANVDKCRNRDMDHSMCVPAGWRRVGAGVGVIGKRVSSMEGEVYLQHLRRTRTAFVQ